MFNNVVKETAAWIRVEKNIYYIAGSNWGRQISMMSKLAVSSET
jgi:hypothetical protein